MTDQPKLWRDMTREEKGALLLAHHEGEVIEWAYFLPGGNLSMWRECPRAVGRVDYYTYRVRPEPVRETVELHGRRFFTDTHPNGVWDFDRYALQESDTHRITFDVIDCKPDCASIRMDEL